MLIWLLYQYNLEQSAHMFVAIDDDGVPQDIMYDDTYGFNIDEVPEIVSRMCGDPIGQFYIDM